MKLARQYRMDAAVQREIAADPFAAAIRKRADAEWDAMPDTDSARAARAHLAAMAPERRAALEHEWNTQGSAGQSNKRGVVL